MSNHRDNLPGIKFDAAWKVVLLPGFLIQWLIYMSPSAGVVGVAISRRHARSPAMTYVYSAAFWVVMLICLIEYGAPKFGR